MWEILYLFEIFLSKYAIYAGWSNKIGPDIKIFVTNGIKNYTDVILRGIRVSVWSEWFRVSKEKYGPETPEN